MPKARKSSRNSDAMDAEGHEEVRDVFVVFPTSSRFFIFFFESVCIFLRAVVGRNFPPFASQSIRPIQSIQFLIQPWRAF